MSIFGQVWLWSLLSFLAGVFLTWLVMVRPAKKQVQDLEDQLFDARSLPAPAPVVVEDVYVDEWDAPAPSLADEVLEPAEPVVEPVAERFDEPVGERFYEPVGEFPEESLQEYREELPEEDDRPRSLFERLSPEVAPPPAEATAVFSRSGLQASDFDDEPELPVEQTQFIPTPAPTAEVAPRDEEPTAPPEVDEQPVEEYVFQPREAWREEDEIGYVEEAPERSAEETSFIPVADIEQAIAAVDEVLVEDAAEDEQQWPETDLTGEYSGLKDEIASRLAAPEPVAEPEPEPVPVAVAEPEVPRSLFEPVVDVEGEETVTPADQPRPAPAAFNDQPFVPTLAPGLTETATGLPQRPARGSAPPRPVAFQTPPTPAPAPPEPARPVRPRPVGFSPSTGGHSNGATSPRYQQPEGFNPRSPFGPGSVLPKSDGLAPAPDFEVKATLTGRRYFTNESANFVETRADVWFRTIADAQKAGFRPAP